MNDSRTFRDEHAGAQSQPPLGEELLPPVEQPSARFIIQLFVVPALIVLAIVGVWLTFSWLVRQTTTQPKDLIRGLEQGPSIARWQRASELADMLRNKRYADLKRDGQSAADIAQILEREIEEGAMEENDVEFRSFLARALGEFDVQEGIDAMLKAAETNRDPKEKKVRDSAVQAIATRAYNLHRLDPPQELSDADLEPTLERLAGDEDPAIRFQTAYALSHVGTPAAIKRLEAMVDDPDFDTRYNAAIALANRGNAAAVETLAEMLDIDELARIYEETNEEKTAPNLIVFVQPALAAAEALAQRNPKADLSPVIAALERIVSADSAKLDKAHLPSGAVSYAKRTLQTLEADK